MRRASFTSMLLGLILILLSMPVAATDNAKWFVCKYTGTPGVNEVLQTGDNPISVSENAIPVSPVSVGVIFSDGQGRSLVIEEDIGQAEPAAECPEVPPPPPPTPTPTPSPTPTGTPPQAEQFSVTVCPLDATASTNFTAGMTALDVPDGQSAIRFQARRALLLIILLNVRVDGQLVTLQNTFGDGTVGDVIVSPGDHAWSISNAADTEVLASGVVDCPVCNAAAVSPTPSAVPPAVPLVPNTALPVVQGVGLVAGTALMLLGALLLLNARSRARRR